MPAGAVLDRPAGIAGLELAVELDAGNRCSSFGRRTSGVLPMAATRPDPSSDLIQRIAHIAAMRRPGVDEGCVEPLRRRVAPAHRYNRPVPFDPTRARRHLAKADPVMAALIRQRRPCRFGAARRTRPSRRCCG